MILQYVEKVNLLTRFVGISLIMFVFSTFVDFCDIPDLIQHLQGNYKFWKKEEDSPSQNYDLSKNGPPQKSDNAKSDKSTNSNSDKSTTENNIDARTGDNT